MLALLQMPLQAASSNPYGHVQCASMQHRYQLLERTHAFFLLPAETDRRRIAKPTDWNRKNLLQQNRMAVVGWSDLTA